MIYLPIILKFLKANWKKMLVWAAIGVVVLGVASFIGSYRLRGATIERQEIIISSLNEQLASKLIALDKCQEINNDWVKQSEAWNEATRKLQEEADASYQRYLVEREKRLNALESLEAAQAQITQAITSERCEDAVGELLGALGWLP